MSNATSPSSTVETPKVKNEQHELSASASRWVRSASASSPANSNRARVGPDRSIDRRVVANRSSNSASRSGRSTVGSVHASTEAHPRPPGPLVIVVFMRPR